MEEEKKEEREEREREMRRLVLIGTPTHCALFAMRLRDAGQVSAGRM